MMAKVRILEDNKICFICPGCNQEHQITTAWQYNQDPINPTFTPSVLVRGGRSKANTPPHDTELFVCHSFIENGFIKYLADCTHALANQTVLLPEYQNEEQVSSN